MPASRGAAHRTAAASPSRRSGSAASGDYLAHHPHGREAVDVRARLKAQEAANRAAADDAAFARARGLDTVTGFDTYLSAYPRGRHANAVRAARLRALVRDDDAAYGQAQKRGVVGYRRYLSAWPNGRHADDARRHLEEIEADNRRAAEARALANRRAERERMLTIARGIQTRATGERVIGGLKLGGGLVLLGGAIWLLAAQPLGDTSYTFGMALVVPGVVLPWFSRGNFRHAGDLTREAQHYHNRARQLVGDSARPRVLAVGFAF